MITLKLKIKNKEQELSIREAKELYEELKLIFHQQTNYYNPNQPYGPIPKPMFIPPDPIKFSKLEVDGRAESSYDTLTFNAEISN